MIMTLFLWHMTAMLIALAAGWGLGGFGLGLVPDSSAWWSARPLWMGAFAAVLVPLVGLFARFERPSPATARVSRGRLVTGASLVAFGLGSAVVAGLSALSSDDGED